MHVQASHLPRKFARDAQRVFEEAADRVGVVERTYRIARKRILLRFAGGALFPALTPAIDHLRCEVVERPDLTVSVFDSESTRTPMPPPPWEPDAYGSMGRIEGFESDDVQVAFNLASGILSLLDRQASTAVFWMQTPRAPYWETAAPLRTILHWQMRDGRTQLVHAAAVGYPSGGALITARSGSGKSTAALACVASDLSFVSDDYVAVEDSDRMPFAHSLYQAAKICPDNLFRLSHLGLKPLNADRLDDEKAVLLPGERYPDRITSGFPLRCIMTPRVTGLKETRIRPARKAEALLSLAPTTLFHLPGSSELAFDKMRALVRKLPTYRLELGSEVSRIPSVIGDFLRSEFR